MRQIRIKSFQFLSSLGFSLSMLCAIHCLAMPFIIAFAPLLGSFLSHKAEAYILVISAALAIYVFISNLQQHGNFWPLILLMLSVGSSFAGLVLFHDRWEIPLMSFGGLSMASAYYINWKAQKKSCPTAMS
ncbi:MerC mercury resistance protein [Spirosomataceae bacterium TFI 002]|nr:MerC mercury resistance protein [Spirosomataceae bacterium TFI 002]